MRTKADKGRDKHVLFADNLLVIAFRKISNDSIYQAMRIYRFSSTCIPYLQKLSNY